VTDFDSISRHRYTAPSFASLLCLRPNGK
jgi:hypothetical protein